MGAEKFFNIKCRVSGLKPDAVVVVATVRALKVHSGKYKVRPGKPLPEEMLQEDPEAVLEGAANLVRHLENVGKHGVPAVVAVNRFPTDFDSEVNAVLDIARGTGAVDAVVSEVHAKGGEGGEALAEAVVKACDMGVGFQAALS